MSITTNKLKKIILEEVKAVIKEMNADLPRGEGGDGAGFDVGGETLLGMSESDLIELLKADNNKYSRLVFVECDTNDEMTPEMAAACRRARGVQWRESTLPPS